MYICFFCVYCICRLVSYLACLANEWPSLAIIHQKLPCASETLDLHFVSAYEPIGG